MKTTITVNIASSVDWKVIVYLLDKTFNKLMGIYSPGTRTYDIYNQYKNKGGELIKIRLIELENDHIVAQLKKQENHDWIYTITSKEVDGTGLCLYSDVESNAEAIALIISACNNALSNFKFELEYHRSKEEIKKHAERIGVEI